MTKKILVINGHPDPESLCTALAKSYAAGAAANGGTCRILQLSQLSFDPVLHHGYRQRTELEPDLLSAQQAIREANHLVFVYPVWWGTYPALLKGFFDRVFLPGFAFKYRDNSPFWDKYLKGKSARLIATMDSPPWYNCLVYRNASQLSIKRAILNFCGVSPVKSTVFGPVKTASTARREAWLAKAEALGRKGR